MNAVTILFVLQNVLPFPTEFCEPLMPNDWKISKNGKETTFRSHDGFFKKIFSSIFLLSAFFSVKMIKFRKSIFKTTQKIHGKITRTIFNRTKSRATFEIDGPIKIEKFAWKKCNINAKRSVS